MKKTNYSYLVWGFLFLTIGIIWAGNIGNYWYVDIPYLLFYKGFWTFFIILPCIVNIFQKGFQVSTVTAVVVSALLFSAKMGFFDLSMAKRLILPVLLIIIGLSFFIHCFFPDEEDEDTTPEQEDDSGKTTRNFEGIFCSKAVNYDNLPFHGCSLSSTFGEVRLNISEAEFPTSPVHITCNAMFGTLDIHVPEKINLEVKGTRLFGGIHNYRKGNAPVEDAPTIYIEATCIFGGIDIR